MFTDAITLGRPTSSPHGLGGPGGWWILYDPELHLGRDVLVPDWGRVTALLARPARGVSVDARSDLLAFGVVLCERLVGSDRIPS